MITMMAFQPYPIDDANWPGVFVGGRRFNSAATVNAVANRGGACTDATGSKRGQGLDGKSEAFD
jgi:hypothetical protein